MSSRGFVDGAGYTDVKAQLPAINLLLLISIASFLLFIVNIWRRGWTLPILGVGLWALVAVVAGAIYPQFVQRVQVTPERAREGARRTSQRNIEATRAAIGLSADGRSRRSRSTSRPTRTRSTSRPTRPSVRNIRIWDPSPAVLGKTFPQLQRVRDYYRINDVDVDRYELDGSPTQVVLSVRDLNTANVPRDTWAAKHLTYTHGYGAVVAPANAKESSGEPNVRRPGRARTPPTAKDLAARPAGGLLRREAVAVRRGRHQASRSSTTRTTRARSSRPTTARTACRSTTC